MTNFPFQQLIVTLNMQHDFDYSVISRHITVQTTAQWSRQWTLIWWVTPNGALCTTVGPITRTAGILTYSAKSASC